MKLISGFVFALLLGTMFVSLFHMSANMSMGMSDCPFMAHEETLCPMNFADHLGAWKSTFLATATTLTSILALAGIAVTIAGVAPNLLSKPKYMLLRRYFYPRERTYSFSYRPLQELFSNGILHPKLF